MEDHRLLTMLRFSKKVGEDISEIAERMHGTLIENPGVTFTVVEPLTRPANLWYTTNFDFIKNKCREIIEA